MLLRDAKVQIYIENNGVNSVVPNRKPFVNGFSESLLDESKVLYPRDDQRYHYGNASVVFGFVFKIIQDIPYDRFYYPIIFSLNSISTIIDKLEIESRILNSINKGQCKLLLVCPYEGWSFKKFWNPLLTQIKTKFNLTNENFVIMDGGYLKNPDVSTVTYNFWEEQRLDSFSQPALENIDALRRYKFICMNRRPSPHRMALVTKLFDYRQEGILTLAKHGGFGESYYKQFEQEFFKEFLELKNDYTENIFPKIPLVYNDGINPEVENPNYDDKIEKFHQSYLHIVTETHYDTDTLFLSEKIFKPMWHCQPFIVFGNPGTLKQLRKLGYKTFDEFIDESYDLEQDANKRLNMLTKSITDFISKSPDELTEIMKKMKYIFEHNLNNIDRRHGICIKFSLLNDLRNALYENR